MPLTAWVVAGFTASNEAARRATSSWAEVEARLAASALSSSWWRLLRVGGRCVSSALGSGQSGQAYPSSESMAELEVGSRRTKTTTTTAGTLSLSHPSCPAQLHSRAMQESKLKITPADIQSALLDSLNDDAASSAQDSANLDPDSSSTATAGEQDPTADGYTDGDLPDFSDDEPEQPAARAPQQQQPSTSRLIPGKGKPRGKVPLAALKNRIQVGGASSAKKQQAQAAPSSAPAPAPASASSATSSTAAHDKGKGKGKAVKFSGKQLDDVAARIVKDHPELEGQLGRDDVQHLLETLQIDKDVIRGDKGFMGKGAKGMGCVVLSSSSSPSLPRCRQEDLPLTSGLSLSLSPSLARSGHKFWRTQPVPQLEESASLLSPPPCNPLRQPADPPGWTRARRAGRVPRGPARGRQEARRGAARARQAAQGLFLGHGRPD